MKINYELTSSLSESFVFFSLSYSHRLYSVVFHDFTQRCDMRYRNALNIWTCPDIIWTTEKKRNTGHQYQTIFKDLFKRWNVSWILKSNNKALRSTDSKVGLLIKYISQIDSIDKVISTLVSILLIHSRFSNISQVSR